MSTVMVVGLIVGAVGFCLAAPAYLSGYGKRRTLVLVLFGLLCGLMAVSIGVTKLVDLLMNWPS